MGYKVIDNFLSDADHQAIQNSLLGPGFPWYYNDYKPQEGEVDTPYNYQLTHLFYAENAWRSEMSDLLLPIVEKIKPREFFRIKANLSLATDSIRVGRWHKDFDFECKTAVYYVNTNNGFTRFRDGASVESVANRFVVFDSGDLHVGSTATDQKARCLINFNFVG